MQVKAEVKKTFAGHGGEESEEELQESIVIVHGHMMAKKNKNQMQHNPNLKVSL